MLLYNGSIFQLSFANAYKEHPLRGDIKEFFSLKNMIDNLGIRNIYTSNNSFQMFLESSDISKVCLLASAKFNLPFKYKDESYIPAIKSYEPNESIFQKKIVQNYDFAVELLKEHNKNSPLVARSAEKKQNSIIARKEKYEKMSNIDRDFSHKIVSIDFEFNPAHEVKRHIDCVTEFGLSIQENGKKTNHHYLIDDNATVKETQFQFKFGKTQIISRSEAVEILSSHVQDAKYLLFHSHSEDYGILKANKVKMREDMEILDTLYFYRKVLQGNDDESSISLKNLLTILDLSGEHFHNSGNDAVYTLDAFNRIHKLYLESLNNGSELSRIKEQGITSIKQEIINNVPNTAVNPEEPSKNSRLYNLETVQKAFANFYSTESRNKEIHDYFDVSNIFKKIAGFNVYTENAVSSILIDRKGLLKLCSKESKDFSLPFVYKNDEHKPAITYSYTDERIHTKHIVKSQEDVLLVAKEQMKKIKEQITTAVNVAKSVKDSEKRKTKLSM